MDHPGAETLPPVIKDSDPLIADPLIAQFRAAAEGTTSVAERNYLLAKAARVLIR